MTIPTPRGWLLDTNVISELRKERRCHPGVRAWAEAVPPAACFLSRITVAEVRFGISRVADAGFRAELEAWLRDGVRTWFGERILDVDEEVLLVWRRLIADARTVNYTYAQPDALIAATALVHELGVVTRKAEDFVRAGVALLNPWVEGPAVATGPSPA